MKVKAAIARRDLLQKGALAGAAGATAAFATPAIAKGVKRWRMQTTWQANAPLLATGPELVVDYITRASGGRLEVKLYAAGEIAPPFQVLDAVADGGLDLGHGYPAYWTGKLPAVHFLTPMPFGLTAQEQNAWLSFGGGREIAEKIYARLGVKFFPSGNTSVQAAGWFNKEINAISDYQGLKIRSGGLGAKVLRAVGATPVQMPLGQVPQALQTGAIDGADFVGPFNDMAFGLHKVAKYYYWPGWMEPCGVLDCFVNLNSWNALPDDLKAIVEGANKLANATVLDEFVAKNAQAYRKMIREHGVQIKYLDEQTLTALGTAANDVISEAANADALSREIYQSIITFRKDMLDYTNTSELAFMNSRNLEFPYG